MEPPTKRRRLVESESEGSDDDELAYEPHEVVARKDPDYQLNLKRAYADHKFQATMAHIFEKYGRDFEGVGDEIDMVTGEIVVNNGHLDRMRNEGDVGLGTPQDESEPDEDKGVSLSELFGLDVEEEEEEEDETVPDDVAQNKEVNGQDLQRKNANFPEHDAFLGSLPDVPLDSFHRYPGPDFGPSPYGLSLGNYGFGASPFVMGPWDLPPEIARIPLSTPRPPSFLNIRTGRYEFPVKDGRSSIWAQGRHKEDEPVMPLPKMTLTPQAKVPVVKGRKKISRPSDTGPEDGTKDDLVSAKEVPLANKPLRTRLAKESGRARRSAQVDEAIPEATSTLPPGAQNEPKKIDSSTIDEASNPKTTSVGPASVQVVRSKSASATITRRKTQPSTTVQVELVSLDPRIRDEYRHIDPCDEVPPPSTGDAVLQEAGAEQKPQPDFQTVIPDSQSSGLVVPNSQSTGASSTEPPLPPPPALNAVPVPNTHKDGVDHGSMFLLSDDEAPVPLRPRKMETTKKTAASNRRSRPRHTIPRAAKLGAINELSKDAARETTVIMNTPSQVISQTTSQTATDEQSDSPPNLQETLSSAVSHASERPGLNATEIPASSEENATQDEVEESLPAVEADGTPIETNVLPDNTVFQEPSTRTSVTNPGPLPQNILPSPKNTGRGLAHASSIPSVIQDSQSQSSEAPPSSNHSPSTNLASEQQQQKQQQLEPSTPRHSIRRRPLRAPSSRRSVLSLVSDEEDAEDPLDKEMDELGRGGLPTNPGSRSSVMRKVWKSSARTTEVYRTPVKRNRTMPASPGSTIKTPGGTTRTCGIAGFRCERDFCFTCL